jgi:hypothetical protein
MLKRVNKRNIIVFVIIGCMIVTSMPISGSALVEIFTPDYNQFDNQIDYSLDNEQEGYSIVILYSELDPTILKARSLFVNTIKDVIHFEMILIEDKDTLINSILSFDKFTMVSYFFHGSLKGMTLDSQTNNIIGWEELKQVILASTAKYHLFATCFSDILTTDDQNKFVFGQAGITDYKVSVISLGMALGIIYEDFNPIFSQFLLTRTSSIINADKFDFMLRLIDPKEPMNSIHYKSNALRTVEELFAEIEAFFKDVQNNPSLEFLEVLIELVGGDVDLSSALETYGGVGGEVKREYENEELNQSSDLGLTYWVGRTTHAYKHGEASIVDYDVFLDVLQVKISVKVSHERIIMVSGIPVTLTFTVEGVLALEFLLEYYGSDPNDINDPSNLYEGTVSDPTSLVAYAKADGLVGDMTYIEANFGAPTIGLPVSFRLYGEIGASVVGEVKIPLDKVWSKLPSLKIPVEAGGKVKVYFSLGGDGVTAQLNANIYGKVGWDDTWDVVIGSLNLNLYLQVDIPFRSNLFWNSIGMGVDDAIAYWPKITAAANLHFSSKAKPFIPDIDFDLLEALGLCSGSACDGDVEFYLPSGPKTTSGDHPANILATAEIDVSLDIPIDEVISLDLFPAALDSLLGGTGEITPGSAFDRTPPEISMLTTPGYVDYLTCDYLSLILHPENLFNGAFWDSCTYFVNPLDDGDEQVLKIRTTDAHDNLNTASYVKDVAVGIDSVPSRDITRTDMNEVVSRTNTGVALTVPSNARMFRYLLHLDMNDVRSYVTFTDSYGNTYPRINTLNAIYPNLQPNEVKDISDILKTYHDVFWLLGLLAENFKYDYSFLSDAGHWAVLSGLDYLADLFGFDWNLEELRDILPAMASDDVYVWSPWISGNTVTLNPNLCHEPSSTFPWIGHDDCNDGFTIEAVEYFSNIQWSSLNPSTNPQGYIDKLEETETGLGTNQTYKVDWNAYIDLYTASLQAGLVNGWHDFYIVAVDSSGLETIVKTEFFIDNPKDALAPEIVSELALQEFVEGVPVDTSIKYPPMLTTFVFKTKDAPESVTYDPVYRSAVTYDLDTGIDFSTVTFSLNDENGDLLFFDDNIIPIPSGDWYQFLISIDLSTFPLGNYLLSLNVADYGGHHTVAGYWLVVGESTGLIENGGFEIGTTGTGTSYWTESRAYAGSNGPSGDDNYSPWFDTSVKNSGSYAATIKGPWCNGGRTKISSASLDVSLGLRPGVSFYQGIGGTASQWGYYSWTGTRILVSNGVTTKGIVWMTHKGVNIPVDGKYTHSTYTEGIETYFYKPSYAAINTLYNFNVDVSSIFEEQFGSSSGYKIVKVEMVGQGQSCYGQSGWSIVDDIDIQFNSMTNGGFESGTSGTGTNSWTESRVHSYAYGPPGDDNYSPWFDTSVKNSGSYAATIMGPWCSNGRAKLVSESMNVPLSDDPVVDFYQGIGGTGSQWGYYSWTGTRFVFSNGATTKAIVWMTHKGAYLTANGIYTHSTFTEGIQTYFYRPSYGPDPLTHFSIDLQPLFEQKFGSSSGYELSRVELVGQGQGCFGQHGWAIVDDIYVFTPPPPPPASPNTPPKPTGPTTGYETFPVTFSFTGSDPNTDGQLKFVIDWGDGTSTTTGYYSTDSSGSVTKSFSHTYSTTGTYLIKFYVVDEGGLPSSYSPTHTYTAYPYAP